MEFTNITSKNIWEDRYKKNNETLSGNFKRVAKYCANNEDEETEFFNLFESGQAYPAGRTMSNAGIGRDLTLNNCFTSPLIKDDLRDIFEKVSLGASTHQKGGGIGYNFSQLRPKDSPTSNDAIASGAISFMDVFNSQTATILQGNRRGANMGLLSIYHLDIEDFINAKSKDATRLVHFNLTVLVDDDFMIAKNKNQKIWLHHPVYDNNGKLLKDESKWIYKKEVDALDLWNKIIKQAYDNGEPGIAFETTMNKDNNLWYIENIQTTNPCFEYLAGTVFGENPKTKEILDSSKFGGACNLGSLFLHNFVENPFTKDAVFNYTKLKPSIKSLVTLLDNIIDKNKFPDIIYENYQKNFRTIGLGCTGLADVLAMLNMKYNDEKAMAFTDNLMEFIAVNTYQASIELAKTKGEFPFLNRNLFIKSNFIQKHISSDSIYKDQWKKIVSDIEKYGIRNAKLLSVAPTGTLSLTFGNNCSSGIEPIFSLSSNRKVKFGGQSDEDIQVVTFQDYAYSVFKNMKPTYVSDDIFVTANQLDVTDHINMLSVIARHIDMSVSKTINVPTSYSFEEAKKIYDLCWKKQIKGCTIFRPNELRQGILSDSNQSTSTLKNVDSDFTNIPWGTTINMSDELIGKKRKIVSGCGTIHVQAWFDEFSGKLMELYLSKGSDGGCNSWMVGSSRGYSLALRTGASFEAVVDQLKSTPSCAAYAVRRATKNDTSKGNCCPNAVANALINMQAEINDELGIEDIIQPITNKSVTVKPQEDKFTIYETEYKTQFGEIAFAKKFFKCPHCGSALQNAESCLSCTDCGFTKCG